MIVCVCHRVSDRDIARAAADGIDSFDALQDELRVATQCGACHECALDTFLAHRGRVGAGAGAGAGAGLGACAGAVACGGVMPPARADAPVTAPQPVPVPVQLTVPVPVRILRPAAQPA